MLVNLHVSNFPQRKKNKSHYLEIFHFSDINTRVLAYMTIDINRRLLIYYGYINVLDTITQLNEQLPLRLMNEVRERWGIGIERCFCYSLEYAGEYL